MHPELAEALTVAARSNAAVNDLLVAHLSKSEMLDAWTPGRFTVAEQLAHMAHVQTFWLSKLSAGAAEALTDLHDLEQQLAGRDPVAPSEPSPARTTASTRGPQLLARDVSNPPSGRLYNSLPWSGVTRKR